MQNRKWPSREGRIITVSSRIRTVEYVCFVNAYITKKQFFSMGGSKGVGDAWLFWAGIKQKCRVGVGGSGKCRKMGHKCLKWMTLKVVTSGVQRAEISSKQCKQCVYQWHLEVGCSTEENVCRRRMPLNVTDLLHVTTKVHSPVCQTANYTTVWNLPQLYLHQHQQRPQYHLIPNSKYPLNSYTWTEYITKKTTAIEQLIFLIV